MRGNGTKRGQLLLAGLILVIAVGTVGYLWIDRMADEAYFSERATRLLAQVADELGDKVTLYKGIVRNAAKEHGAKLTIEALVPGLNNVDGNDSGKCDEIGKEDVAVHDEGGGEFHLYFRSTGPSAAPEQGDAPAAPKLCARTPIKKFVEPMLPEREFDQLLVVHSSGIVIYHHNATAARIIRFPQPDSPTKDDKRDEGPSREKALPTIDRLLSASTATPVQFGELEHRLFCQPVAFGETRIRDYPTVDLPGWTSNWAVCGLIESHRLGQTSSAASKPLVALSPLFLLGAILAWPLLRLSSMGARERMSGNDVRFLCVCAVLATGTINAVAIYGISYSQQVAKLDERLVLVGKQLHDSFLDELKKAHAALQAYTNQILPRVLLYDSRGDDPGQVEADIKNAIAELPRKHRARAALEQVRAAVSGALSPPPSASEAAASWSKLHSDYTQLSRDIELTLDRIEQSWSGRLRETEIADVFIAFDPKSTGHRVRLVAALESLRGTVLSAPRAWGSVPVKGERQIGDAPDQLWAIHTRLLLALEEAQRLNAAEREIAGATQKKARDKLRSALDDAIGALSGGSEQERAVRTVVRQWRNLIFGLPVANILQHPTLPQFMLEEGAKNEVVLPQDIDRNVEAVIAHYADFEMIGWADRNRMQREKWSIRETTTPLIKGGVDPQPGFEWEHEPHAACRAGGGLCKRARYHLDVVQSLNTGQPISVVSMEIEGVGSRGGESVPRAFMVSNLVSVDRPVVPWNLEVALIEKASGRVLFHSTEQRRLRETFYEEFVKGRVLKAALAAGRDEIAGGDYHGAPYRVYAYPVEGTSVAVIVFADLEPHRTAYAEALFTSILTFGAYVLLGFLALSLCRWLLPTSATSWLWPTPARKGRYFPLIIGLAPLSVIFGWADYWYSGPTLAIFTLLIPVTAMVSCRLLVAVNESGNKATVGVLVLVLVAAYGVLALALSSENDMYGIALLGLGAGTLAVCGKLADRKATTSERVFEGSYVCFLLMLILVIAALPSFAILKDCLVQTQELLWRREQLQFARELAARAERTGNLKGVPPQYRRWRLQDVSDIHASGLFEIELPSKSPLDQQLECACRDGWIESEPVVTPLVSPVDYSPARRSGRDCRYCIASLPLNGDDDGIESDDANASQRRWPYVAFVDWLSGPAESGSLRNAQITLLKRHFTSIFGTLTLPVYNTISGELRYAAFDSAKDGRWTSRINGKRAVMQYVDPRFRNYLPEVDQPGVIVRAQLPSLNGPVRPLAQIFVGIVLLILVGAGYLALRWLARSVFGVDRTWEPESSKCTAIEGQHELWIAPARSKVDELAPPALPVDARSPASIRAAIAALSDRRSVNGRTILIDYFDHGFGDPLVIRDRVDLLVRLAASGAARIVVVSSVDPMSLLSELSRDSAEQVDRALARQALEQLAPVLENFRRQDFVAPAVQLSSTLPTSRVNEILRAECSSTSRLAGIESEILAEDRAYPSREHLLSHLLDHARAHYVTLWSSCTEDERVVLVHLAQDGFVNPKSWGIVEKLQARRLVRVAPRLGLMNETFRRFVLSAETSKQIKTWENVEGVSDWQQLRAVLVVLLLGAAVFLFVTQRDVFDMSLALLGGIAGSIPLIVRLAGLFQRSSTGSAAAT